MDPAIAHLDLGPPRQPVFARGVLPALLAHGVLALALAGGVQWKRTPDPARVVAVPGWDQPAVAQSAPEPPAAAPTTAAATTVAPTAAAPTTATPPAAVAALPSPVAVDPAPPSRVAMGAAAERPPARPPADASARPRPSFDCARARSTPERLICADEDLSRLDRELGRLHARAKAAAPDPVAFKQQNDEEWRLRERACRDRECLLAWYAHRREQLEETLALAQAGKR